MKAAFPIEDTTLPAGLETFSTSRGKGVRTVWDANTIFLWHLDEADGSATSGHAVAKSVIGPTTIAFIEGSSVVGASSGKFGTAYNHPSGAALYASQSAIDEFGTAIGLGSLIRTAGQSITIDAWINLDTISATNGIQQVIARVEPYGTTLANWAFDVHNLGGGAGNGGRVRFYFYSTGAAYHIWTSAANVIAATATWYHVAVVYTYGSGASLKMFVDGVDITAGGSWTTGTGNADPYVTNPLSLHVGNKVGNPLLGSVDELRVSSNLRYSGNFTPETAAYKPYTAGGLTIDDALMDVNLGTGLIGTFDPTTLKIPAFIDGTVAAESSTAIEVQYSLDNGASYNGSWLTVDGFQAVSALTFTGIQRLRLKIRVTTDGYQLVRLYGPPTITVTSIAETAGGAGLAASGFGFHPAQG